MASSNFEPLDNSQRSNRFSSGLSIESRSKLSFSELSGSITTDEWTQDQTYERYFNNHGVFSGVAREGEALEEDVLAQELELLLTDTLTRVTPPHLKDKLVYRSSDFSVVEVGDTPHYYSSLIRIKDTEDYFYTITKSGVYRATLQNTPAYTRLDLLAAGGIRSRIHTFTPLVSREEFFESLLSLKKTLEGPFNHRLISDFLPVGVFLSDTKIIGKSKTIASPLKAIDHIQPLGSAGKIFEITYDGIPYSVTYRHQNGRMLATILPQPLNTKKYHERATKRPRRAKDQINQDFTYAIEGMSSGSLGNRIKKSDRRLKDCIDELRNTTQNYYYRGSRIMDQINSPNIEIDYAHSVTRDMHPAGLGVLIDITDNEGHRYVPSGHRNTDKRFHRVHGPSKVGVYFDNDRGSISLIALLSSYAFRKEMHKLKACAERSGEYLMRENPYLYGVLRDRLVAKYALRIDELSDVRICETPQEKNTITLELSLTENTYYVSIGCHSHSALPKVEIIGSNTEDY